MVGVIYTMDTGKCYKWDIFVESQVVKYLSAIIATTRLTYKNFKRLAISGGPGHVGKKIRGEKNLQGLSNPHNLSHMWILWLHLELQSMVLESWIQSLKSVLLMPHKSKPHHFSSTETSHF